MTLNEYQDAASRTAIYPKEGGLTYTTLKLGSEAGELQGKLGKFIRGDFDEKECCEKMIMELGDILWYVSQVAKELHVTLDTVAQLNITKLIKRAEAGKLKGDGDNR